MSKESAFDITTGTFLITMRDQTLKPVYDKIIKGLNSESDICYALFHTIPNKEMDTHVLDSNLREPQNISAERLLGLMNKNHNQLGFLLEALYYFNRTELLSLSEEWLKLVKWATTTIKR